MHQQSPIRPSPAQSDCQCQPNPTFTPTLVSPIERVRSVSQSLQAFVRVQTLRHPFISAIQQTCRFCLSYPMKRLAFLVHRSLFTVAMHALQELLAVGILDLFTPSRVFLWRAYQRNPEH